MIYIWLVLTFVIGIGLGYGIFYFRYKDTKRIDQLRKNYEEQKKEFQEMQKELDEVTHQNEILKDECRDLREDNQDLNSIVAKLSKYAFHIEKAFDKTMEVVEILDVHDEDIRQKINYYMDQKEWSEDEQNDWDKQSSVSDRIKEKTQNKKQINDWGWEKEDMKENLKDVKKMF